jgi:uncharacterized protein YjlB
MTISSKRTAPITHKFADDGSIPNNAALPLVLYRGGIDLAGLPDPEELIEKTFAQNGWGGLWRAHCHTMVYEALGSARGRATVHFGGKSGRDIAIKSADVVILPAGTGHRLVARWGERVLIGADPPNGTFDLGRANKAEHDRALAAIANLPPPTDPVFGPSDPLMKLWRA